MAPPGLTALGAKGSACDRLRLTGGLRAFALGSYIVPLRWEGMAPFRAPFFMPPLAAKTFTTGHMDKPQWGLRVDGPSGRRFLRGLSLTRLWREGCCGRLILLKAPSYNKTFTTGLSPVGKPYNRPAGVGNAPLLVAGATTFPPAGGLYSSLCVSFILPLCTSCIGCASRSK